jgi:N-acylneuraminate cytidylyltransferase
MRPHELATDTAPEFLAWQHAVETIQSPPLAIRLDVFVSLPATAPLRSAHDVDRCIELFLKGGTDAVITVTPARRSPHFSMVVLDEHGYARRVIEPQASIARRQDAPVVYDMTAVAYVVRPAFIRSATSLFDGILRAVVVPQERAVDIDTQFDLEFASFLATRASSTPCGWSKRRAAG